MNDVRPDWFTYVGMFAVAVAAAVLSFSALSSLAELAGVSGEVWRFKLAWLLPIAIDAYAVTATRVWLKEDQTARTRKYARANAVGAISLSVLGNGAYHYFASSGVRTLAVFANGWLVVVLVSAVPPIILGLVGHLHALVSADHRDQRQPREREWSPGSTAPAGRDFEHAVQAAAPEPVVPTVPLPNLLTSSSLVPAAGGDAVNGTANRDSPSGEVREVTAVAPVERDGKGAAEMKMRDYWTAERAEGRTPTGADLDRVAGTRDYGRKVRRALLAEEITEPGGTPRDSK
jgi:hypothetical protein